LLLLLLLLPLLLLPLLLLPLLLLLQNDCLSSPPPSPLTGDAPAEGIQGGVARPRHLLHL
jgi:hypothetical protein